MYNILAGDIYLLKANIASPYFCIFMHLQHVITAFAAFFQTNIAPVCKSIRGALVISIFAVLHYLLSQFYLTQATRLCLFM